MAQRPCHLSLSELCTVGSVKCGVVLDFSPPFGVSLVTTNLDAAAVCLLPRKQRLCVQAVQPAVPAQGQQQ